MAACNNRDARALEQLLAPEFTFTDSRGGVIEGVPAMLEALRGVRAVAPDLRVEIERYSSRGNTALLSGRSVTATADLPCDTQWRAVVRDGKLVEWQAYGAPSESSLVGLLSALVART